MPKFLALIAALLLIGGIYYYQEGTLPVWFNATTTPQYVAPSTAISPNVSNEGETTPINSYEECIAAGNKPLPEAPNKCLTKDGHVFIEGVIEE